ncbi:reverse transcriptase domain-containing protein [Tanacetum coccineum]
MELCNGNGIGKIFSGIGKPMLMDKLIKERCLKKSGKIDFARVLVEVYASDDLPNFLEIEYPRLGERHARVGKLEVKYQWKPPLCTHCSTFGHATVSCKVRPRTDEEIAKKATKDALKIGEGLSVKDVDKKIDEDGFVTIGRKSKPAVNQSYVKENALKNRSFNGNFRQNFGR